MIIPTRVNLFVTAYLLLCIETTSAVPAIVWNKSEPAAQDASTYISNEISFEQMLTTESSSMNNNDLTVMFLLERDSKTGQELLTSMTPMLQQTLQHPLAATHKQYSHVTGMESGAHVLKKCKACATSTVTSSPIMEPVLVNLNELGYKLNHTLLSSSSTTEMMMDVIGEATTSMLPPKTTTNKATVKVSKRNRLIEASNFVIVTVPPTIAADVLDATLVQTLQHASVQTMVLSSVRGVNEVKYERQLSMKRQLLDKAIIVDTTSTSAKTTDPYHRRLEEQQQDNNNNDNNNLSGTYYVQMTPNIFSGLLFFGMFTVITMIGISCMNMITGQDVYVSTMPSIGREA